MRYLFFLFLLACLNPAPAQDVHIRTNLIGYFPEDAKVALIMSEEPVTGEIMLMDVSLGEAVMSGIPEPATGAKWGRFPHQYWFNFTNWKEEGAYFVEVEGVKSTSFVIGSNVYDNYQEDLLAFMRQQRCGYNPYFGEVCHQWDGRVFYAPVPDSTYYDFSGGWERGDVAQLKKEMAYLQRRCHRLIWLNPLLGKNDYRPLVEGMAAALPHVDDFLPIHNLQSLQQLAEHLGKLGK